MVDIQNIKNRFSIIGNSQLLNREIEKALRIAPTDLSVLIIGESGVGKEAFPQIIHQNSIRKHGPYIAVNCGAIPEGTIDSELFGHEKGSFTGALSDRKGYFEVADKGTIFLDEVGELPLATQARLLRVLENGEFIKVGSSKVQKTDVRIVAATNVDLLKAIYNGKFREDLYYRLNTVPVNIPALRDRREDILLLFRKFASDFAEKYKMPAIQLTDESRTLLLKYRFQGNIRELKNITERMSIIEQEREITPEILKNYLIDNDVSHLPALQRTEAEQNFNNERELLWKILLDMRKDISDLKKQISPAGFSHTMQRDDTETIRTTVLQPSVLVKTAPQNSVEGKPVLYADEYLEDDSQETADIAALPENMTMEEMEKEMIRTALERHRGKRRNAAQDLKISERTLYRKIKEYGME
ncbi:MAG: sigma-54 dependent transcriptional regulator [Dysgonamonadaceae bacterium]|jgi:transcriptional regulator with PAS, ATPase and Fis domain|nr:sigma-54 dependent transcriptional regulator [Dysgonamonadaceae bacterium]